VRSSESIVNHASGGLDQRWGYAGTVRGKVGVGPAGQTKLFKSKVHLIEGVVKM
jgi:hypothetical protein